MYIHVPTNMMLRRLGDGAPESPNSLEVESTTILNMLGSFLYAESPTKFWWNSAPPTYSKNCGLVYFQQGSSYSKVNFASCPGVIMLPTQTSSHYEREIPSNLPRKLALFDPSKLDNFTWFAIITWNNPTLGETLHHLGTIPVNL